MRQINVGKILSEVGTGFGAFWTYYQSIVEGMLIA